MEKGITFLQSIRERFGCDDVDIRTYSPLTLAYIGDAVYDQVIRTVVVMRGNRSANSLHKIAIGYVNARVQARLAEALEEELTQEEKGIYHRGRNAKSYTMAKNASVIEYRKATGLEALLGYLYLQDKTDRLLMLIQDGIEKIGLKI